MKFIANASGVIAVLILWPWLTDLTWPHVQNEITPYLDGFMEHNFWIIYMIALAVLIYGLVRGLIIFVFRDVNMHYQIWRVRRMRKY